MRDAPPVFSRFQVSTYAMAIPISVELADVIRTRGFEKCEHCGKGPLLVDRTSRWYLHLVCCKCGGTQRQRKITTSTGGQG